jgi:hypothetical protein
MSEHRGTARRHLIVPDVQIRPGVDTAHIGWAAKAILKYLPDVIVVMGDWWDMESLSSWDKPGSKQMEGRRVLADIEAGNEAFERLVAPMEAEIEKRDRLHKKRWAPERHFLFGNHEDRLTRAVSAEPKWDGVLSLDMLKTPGFQRHKFLDVVMVDGVRYNHFYPNPLSGRPIGGSILNRLNHIGGSFVQGHAQGYAYASKSYPDHVCHGLVAGRFYSHFEEYRPDDIQRCEWSGIVVLNNVKDGDFDIMPLRYEYLREAFG